MPTIASGVARAVVLLLVTLSLDVLFCAPELVTQVLLDIVYG